MRKLLVVILAVIAGGAVLSDAANPLDPGRSEPIQAEPVQAKPEAGEIDPTSYAVGHALGSETRSGLNDDGMGVDLDLLAKGFADAISGKDPAVSRREMKEVRVAVHKEMEARRVRRLLADSPKFRQLYDDNLERGRKFRDLFAKQPGVVALPSGAQYLVVKPGDGRSPGPDDAVLVKVRAQLLDRSLIDEGDKPFEIEVSSNLPGGSEILQLMRVGAQWQVVFPPELAYGEGGRFPDVGPNETLILTVDLLQITRTGEGRDR